MKLKFALTLSVVLSTLLAYSQPNTALKITSFAAFEMEVEDDIFMTSLITTTNNLDVTNRHYTVVAGDDEILRVKGYDVVKFNGDDKVKVRAVVGDDKTGRDTSYLVCSQDSRKMDVSTKYYLNEQEWESVKSKIAPQISKRPPMAFVKSNPALPNLLVIGTSISIGYTPYLREALTGITNTYRIPENSNSTEISLSRIDFWLGDMSWDVIHVNWGLHDLKYTRSNEQQDVPPAQYQANLRKLLQRLTDTGAKIIWANTSYVPEGCTPRRDVGDDELYNRLAEEIVKEFADIVIDDQFTLTKNNPDNQLKSNVHFTEDGYRQQAEQASEIVKRVLNKGH